jgi:nucleoside-diphosphate-sugar epimerase
MQRVLVTGAGGFVGSRLCCDLIQSGYQVRASLRCHPPPGQFPPELEIHPVGDIDGSTRWLPALKNVDTVIHLAARTHVLNPSAAGDLDLFRKVNVEGTLALADAAEAAGIRRFIYLSSIKAACESSSGKGAVGEDVQCFPSDAYGISKHESETGLLDHKIESIILRPPLVYGPGVKANFFRLLDAVARGAALPLGRVRAKRSFLYVGNLTDAILRCIGATLPGSRVFHLADLEAVTSAELAQSIGTLMGKPARIFPVPTWALKFAATLLGRTRDVDRLCEPLIVSSEKIRKELGWSPPVRMEQGLRETVAWYSGQKRARAAGGSLRSSCGEM